MKQILLITMCFFSIGCGHRNEMTSFKIDCEFELMVRCIGKYTEGNTDRIYFLTPLPLDKWTGQGLPSFDNDIMDRLKSRGIIVYPGADAIIEEDEVIDRKTKKREWMIWYKATRLSETEIEVDSGVWSCPLGGGGSSKIYEWNGKEWEIKSVGSSWVS